MEEDRSARRVWVALAGFIAAILALGVVSQMGEGGGREDLPIIAEVPEFSLVRSDGTTVTRADFEGRPWVADFIFTTCAGVCPILSTRMGELQTVLAAREFDARLVSITVDPTRDTPDALRRYAERYAADSDRWWFLTGERDPLYDLIGKGFLLSVAERTPGAVDDGGELITHSDRFVLVDREGRIRGYYHGTDREAVDRLVADLAKLVD